MDEQKIQIITVKQGDVILLTVNTDQYDIKTAQSYAKLLKDTIPNEVIMLPSDFIKQIAVIEAPPEKPIKVAFENTPSYIGGKGNDLYMQTIMPIDEFSSRFDVIDWGEEMREKYDYLH